MHNQQNWKQYSYNTIKVTISFIQIYHSFHKCWFSVQGQAQDFTLHLVVMAPSPNLWLSSTISWLSWLWHFWSMLLYCFVIFSLMCAFNMPCAFAWICPYVLLPQVTLGSSVFFFSFSGSKIKHFLQEALVLYVRNQDSNSNSLPALGFTYLFIYFWKCSIDMSNSRR